MSTSSSNLSLPTSNNNNNSFHGKQDSNSQLNTSFCSMYHEQQLNNCPSSDQQLCYPPAACSQPISCVQLHQLHAQQLLQCQLSQAAAAGQCSHRGSSWGSADLTAVPTSHSQTVTLYNNNQQTMHYPELNNGYNGNIIQSQMPLSTQSRPPSTIMTQSTPQSPMTIPHNPYVHSVSPNMINPPTSSLNTKYMCSNPSSPGPQHQIGTFYPNSCDSSKPVFSSSSIQQTLCATAVQCSATVQHQHNVQCQRTVEQFEFECRQNMAAAVVPFPAILNGSRAHYPAQIQGDKLLVAGAPSQDYLAANRSHLSSSSSAETPIQDIISRDNISRDNLSQDIISRHQVLGIPTPRATPTHYNNGYF